METRVCPIPNSLVSYGSAPCSPGRAATNTLSTTVNGGCLFSLPTSPSSRSDDPRTPDLRFGHHHHHLHEEEHLGDERLFRRGRMVPLKLPPRLQGEGATKKCPLRLGRSSSSRARASPRNDEFDPFVIALDKVREYETPRRSRSLSPLKWLPRSNSIGPKSPTVLEDDLMGRAKPARIKRFLLKTASFSLSLSFGWKRTPTTTTTTACSLERKKEVLRISRGIKSLKPRLFSRTR